MEHIRSAVLSLGLLLGLAAAAPAATVGFVVSAPILGGPFDGSPLELLVSYDSAFLLSGDEILSPKTGKVRVSDATRSGLEFADLDYPAFPQIRFADFAPVGFNFFVGVARAPELAALGIRSVWIGGNVETAELFGLDFIGPGTDGVDVYATATTVQLAPVPLPATLPLVLGALGLLGLAGRRRARA